MELEKSNSSRWEVITEDMSRPNDGMLLMQQSDGARHGVCCWCIINAESEGEGQRAVGFAVMPLIH